MWKSYGFAFVAGTFALLEQPAQLLQTSGARGSYAADGNSDSNRDFVVTLDRGLEVEAREEIAAPCVDQAKSVVEPFE